MRNETGRRTRRQAAGRTDAGTGAAGIERYPACMLYSVDYLLFEPPTSSTPIVRTRTRQAQLGQFFTPSAIADFMATMFTPTDEPVRLLDAGAGEGELTAAYARRWADEHVITADCYEIDDGVETALAARLLSLAQIKASSIRADFLERAATDIVLGRGARYDRAILNPPYRKMGTGSPERRLVARAGLETVNLYSGFVGLALQLMQPGGELVAIVPRSFCNGPYYRPFRDLILGKAALRRIHLFGSRSDAFAGDAVLQENVIIHLVRDGVQGDVVVSTSTGASFDDLAERAWPFGEIVSAGDAVIAIPTGDPAPSADDADAVHKLVEIGVDVSTGPVVDFRLRDHLHAMPEPGDVPLLYPVHLRGDGVRWPVEGSKKPNAIAVNATTRRWLFPAGCYVLVKRFSSKEEKRRVVATFVDPARLPGEVVGLENHVNVLHEGRRSLPEMLARGLTVYLNSEDVDRAFRVFSGHTQVNASDLRRMSFPSRAKLEELGRRSMEAGAIHA